MSDDYSFCTKYGQYFNGNGSLLTTYNETFTVTKGSLPFKFLGFDRRQRIYKRYKD